MVCPNAEARQTAAMRMLLLVGMVAGLAACGGGQASSGGGAPTPGRVDEGVHDRPPLAFRPVAEITPGTCDPEVGPDVAPSTTGSQCFHFAGQGITVAAYGAKRSTAAAPPTAAVDVLLTDSDLERFNALASQCFERLPACPTGQIAVVFEGRVHSAPTVHEPSFTGEIAITGEQRDIEEMLRLMSEASD